MRYRLRNEEKFKKWIHEAYELIDEIGLQKLQQGITLQASKEDGKIVFVVKEKGIREVSFTLAEMKWFEPVIKCKVHPQYKVLRKPTADCVACKAMWEGLLV